MRRDRNRRIDDEAVERLLTGDFVGYDALADLLAAAAPARASELAGEEAVVDAFRSARFRSAPARHATPALARRFAWLLSVKVAAISIAVAAAGVALAAGTGALPSLVGDVDSPLAGPDAITSMSTSASVLGTRSASESAPSPGSSASLVGLCQAYLAQLANKPDKLPDHLSFAAMVTAAGRADQVVGFCEDVLSVHPGANPSAIPSRHPTARPSQSAGNGGGHG